MKLSELKIDDDFKSLLPELDAETYTALEKDIVSNGMFDPIVIWNGFIVDGHNRYAICKAHYINEVQVKELKKATKSDAMQWIADHQYAKRNLQRSDRVRIYMKVEAQVEKEKAAKSLANLKQNKDTDESNLTHREEKQSEDGRTAEIMAKKAGFKSKNTWKDAKLIVAEGSQDQIVRMDKGGKGNGINTIAKEIREGVKDGERKCTKCGKIKPLSDFTSGHNYTWCKECENQRRRDAVYKGEAFKNVDKAISSLKNGDGKKTIAGQTGEVKFLVSNFISSVNRIIADYGKLSKDSVKELDTLVSFVGGLKGEVENV